jgi:eukaryotic-like serine/threonine-protein kinase
MQSVLGPGRLVAGRYRLLDQVGRGAMGIVWRSRDELLDRDVAVKQILLPPMASASEAGASYERTLREARTAARLSHPGLVTIFDVVEEDGTPWIVMELIRARPLDQMIAEDGPLPPAQAAQLGRSLLEALVAAHEAGVLHRDVKPSNVLISGDGKAVLTDFGIATMQGDPGLTQAGMVVGTPGFSPPERVRGEPATTASDLWSLGATLYAAVEGRGPFDRAGGSAAIVASVATEPAPRAPSAGPLGPVIDALLRSDPTRRPDAATTAQMLADAGSAAQRADSAAGGQAGLAAGANTGRLGPGGWPAASSQSNQFAQSVPRAQVAPGSEATTATQAAAVQAAVVAAAAAVAVAGHDLAGASADTGTGTGTAGSGTAGAGGGTGSGTRSETDVGNAGKTGPASTGGTGSAARLAVGGQSAHQGAGPGDDVIPDLMATPVFSELSMPVPLHSPELPRRTDVLAQLGPLGSADPGATGPAGPGSPSAQTGPAAQPRGPGDSPATSAHSRRALVLLACVAALALLTAGVWFEFPGFRANVAQGLDNPSRPGVGTAGFNPHPPVQRSSGPDRSAKSTRPGSGTSGTPKPSSGRTPAGKHTASGKPTQSSVPSPSGQPTPSGQPSPSASPSPSPTPSPTSTVPPPPPVGYVWQSVTGESVGATAGFRLAAPASWEMIPNLLTVFRPLIGSARMEVNLAPFSVQGPVREARHRQAMVITNQRYHAYHLVSILAITFHGHPAATWVFWWRPRGSVTAIDVTEVFVTIKIAPGEPQSYVLSMSAPAPRAGWASGILRVAMRTFKPLPY